jgi:hypothetical protein
MGVTFVGGGGDGTGYQGPGTFDENGNWISTPGTGVNSVPRVINTPRSSTGQPAYADPSAPEFDFATPQGGQLVPSPNLTPNSSTGAPAPGPPSLTSSMIGAAGRAAPALTGLGILAAPALTGPTTAAGMPAAIAADDAARKQFWDWWHNWFGAKTQQPALQNGPLPVSGLPGSQTDPLTQTQTDARRSGSFLPPYDYGGAPPPGAPPPGQLRSPFIVPFGGQRGPRGAPGAAPGAPGAPGAGAVNPADINLGHYRATVGNARGNPTWVPGGEDAVAPQIFRGPLTMFGAGPQGAPRGAQNYYIPGSAPMAPGDWTGTGPAAPPLSNPVWGANSPRGAVAPTRAGGRGGGAPAMPQSTGLQPGSQMPAPPPSRISPNVYLGGSPGTMSPYGPPTKPIPPPSPNVIAQLPADIRAARQRQMASIGGATGYGVGP